MRFDGEIVLRRGAYAVRLAPAAGARMTALTWHDGQREHDLLLPCEPGASFEPHGWPKAGAFALAPFSNKLEQGCFEWEGQPVVLPKTPPFSPHAMHGLAHRVAWRLDSAGPGEAVLSYRHEAGREGWPWDFELGMAVAVSEQQVQVDLQLRNTSPRPMPAGLGWHPFHPMPRGTGRTGVLSLAAAAQRDAGPEGLAVLQPLPPAAATAARAFELAGLPPQTSVFDGWDGRFRLAASPQFAIEVEADGAPHLFCHVPAQGAHVCLEPVTLMPGALRNYQGGLRAGLLALAPGAVRRLRWRCAARRLS